MSILEHTLEQVRKLFFACSHDSLKACHDSSVKENHIENQKQRFQFSCHQFIHHLLEYKNASCQAGCISLSHPRYFALFPPPLRTFPGNKQLILPFLSLTFSLSLSPNDMLTNHILHKIYSAHTQ